MSSYKIKSLRERLMLKEIILDKLPNLSQITYTPYDGDDKYDAEFYQIKEIYGGKAAYSSLIEVKVRNYPLTSFNNWYIEQDKYEYLINQPHDNKLYINFHQDGIQVWDLKKSRIETWYDKNLPANNEEERMRTKKVGDLLVSQSQRIIKPIDVIGYLQRAELIYEKRNK